MNRRLTARMVNMLISGIRFGFGTTANMTKSFFDTVDDVAGHFSGVTFPPRISNAVWGCGQRAVRGTMNLVQEGITEWGRH